MNDNSLNNLGRRYSNVSYGQRWAEVSAAPFRLWKAYATEGGTIVPAIAKLPSRQKPRAAFDEFTHITDLAPTFLTLAGLRDPGTQYKGRTVVPITGSSLVRRLEGHEERGRTRHRVLADELFGRRYVRRDQWKLLWVEPPHGPGDWMLHDLTHDRAESHDVTLQHPEVADELRAEWESYVTRVGLVLPMRPGIMGKP